MYYDGAYAPFGEAYAETGTIDRSFTGQNEDTVAGLYDFLYREQSPIQGRWISPDPGGLAVVSTSDPQTWNRYAYVANNPCSLVDPLGLDTCAFNIQVKNDSGLTDDQLTAAEDRINAIFGATSVDGNTVTANFSFTGKADYTLKIKNKTKLPFVSGALGYIPHVLFWWGTPVVLAGNHQGSGSAFTTGVGTTSAHELVHKIAHVGDIPYQAGSIDPDLRRNLMNADSAIDQGVSTYSDDTDSAVRGFAKLSPNQAQRLWKQCNKRHPMPPPQSPPNGRVPGWIPEGVGFTSESLWNLYVDWLLHGTPGPCLNCVR